MSQSITCGKCKKYINFVSSGEFIDVDEMCNCSNPTINLAEGAITETGEPLSLANKSGNGYVEQQPTIADYLEANKEMIDKTGRKVVTIASLKKFGGLDD